MIVGWVDPWVGLGWIESQQHTYLSAESAYSAVTAWPPNSNSMPSMPIIARTAIMNMEVHCIYGVFLRIPPTTALLLTLDVDP